MAGYLAAQVIRNHFPGGLPDLPRPLLWIEQRLTFEGDPQEYSLVSFPFYRPGPWAWARTSAQRSAPRAAS